MLYCQPWIVAQEDGGVRSRIEEKERQLAALTTELEGLDNQSLVAQIASSKLEEMKGELDALQQKLKTLQAKGNPSSRVGDFSPDSAVFTPEVVNAISRKGPQASMKPPPSQLGKSRRPPYKDQNLQKPVWAWSWTEWEKGLHGPTWCKGLLVDAKPGIGEFEYMVDFSEGSSDTSGQRLWLPHSRRKGGQGGEFAFSIGDDSLSTNPPDPTKMSTNDLRVLLQQWGYDGRGPRPSLLKDVSEAMAENSSLHLPARDPQPVRQDDGGLPLLAQACSHFAQVNVLLRKPQP